MSNKKLPFEYDKYFVALDSLQKKAGEILEKPEAEEEKAQALPLAKECVKEVRKSYLLLLVFY